MTLITEEQRAKVAEQAALSLAEEIDSLLRENYDGYFEYEDPAEENKQLAQSILEGRVTCAVRALEEIADEDSEYNEDAQDTARCLLTAIRRPLADLMVEACYQSEERAVMDGYQCSFRHPVYGLLYKKVGSNGVTYACIERYYNEREA